VPALASRIDSTDIEDLVRQLVGSIGVTGEPPSGDVQEIVLDTEVDGARYLLVRLPRPARNSPTLSPREQEIVRMIAEGHPNKVIAGVLNISPWTVGTHLRRIFAKLGVSSRAALVSHCLELRASRKANR
jgi:DNA-binding CsgD family transcriptional regulator